MGITNMYWTVYINYNYRKFLVNYKQIIVILTKITLEDYITFRMRPIQVACNLYTHPFNKVGICGVVSNYHFKLSFFF